MSFNQGDLEVNGHAIEVRINARGKLPNFLAQPRQDHPSKPYAPGGLGVRMGQRHLTTATASPPTYDIALIGKADRPWPRPARGRWRACTAALGELIVDGVDTSPGCPSCFHALLRCAPRCKSGRLHHPTGWRAGLPKISAEAGRGAPGRRLPWRGDQDPAPARGRNPRRSGRRVFRPQDCFRFPQELFPERALCRPSWRMTCSPPAPARAVPGADDEGLRRPASFPMSDGAEHDGIFWVDPQRPGGCFPLDRFHVSRSLRPGACARGRVRESR